MGNQYALALGRAGHYREALARFRALLPDRERVLGPDHPDTQKTRDWIEKLEAGGGVGSWRGEASIGLRQASLRQYLVRHFEVCGMR